MQTMTMLTKFGIFLILTASMPAVGFTPTAPMPNQLHCPLNSSIVTYDIPHSLHSIYSSEVSGIKFMGFDLAGLPLAEMPLRQSFIAENNDMWSLHCVYARDGLHMKLMTEAYADLIKCRYADGSYQCLGDVEHCVLRCEVSF